MCALRHLRSTDVRQSFIDFFVERGHRVHPSAPLVPHGDPSLLFTNAGMVQFKNYFLGLEQPSHRRAVTAQKCLRVSGKHNDLENVGPSPRHHTFFEMLGNFSFGDYFKAEAIEYGWKLVTDVWGLDPRHLFASVYREDDEAFDLWIKIAGLPPERIQRCGEADNFWAMGDTGPCGPCSEIYVDRHPSQPEVAWEEGTESGRYLEIWNLVFMQFERSQDGTLTPLPNPSIDTGAGLERVTAVVQGKDSNYDTDLFLPILGAAAEAARIEYGRDPARDTSLRVIADHLRAVTFLLADGVIPSNEGRGYVLRRILRRAVRHGMRLGFEEPFLGSLVPVLVEVMGGAYPELAATQSASIASIRAEEEKFLATLANGAHKLQEAIEAVRQEDAAVLAGDVVFRLYDTFGLPLESMREIAEEEQVRLDVAGFEAALEAQRQRSRSVTSDVLGQIGELRRVIHDEGLGATEFLGYDRLELEDARVLRLARAVPGGFCGVDELGSGETGVAVFDRTVFYAEAGGQVADVGELRWSSGRAVVRDVQKAADVIYHTVEVLAGTLQRGATLAQQVDASRRRQTERHHTATHLLHAALRQRLGEGVRQAGSLVHPERLRFDFTFGRPLSNEERESVEETVNHWVRQAAPIEIEWRNLPDALAEGAMALFGEKYGEQVRTVRLPGFSLELCGGCHVRNSGAVGTFVVVSERGIASGVRRIEALAGEEADRFRREQARRLHEVEAELAVPPERLQAEVKELKERVRSQERELSQLRMRLLSGSDGSTAAQETLVDGIKVLTREVAPAPASELRNLADVLRGRLGSGVVVLGTRGEDRVNLILAVTEDLTQKLDAGRLARWLGDVVGGSGGGRRDFAQAGGKDPARLDEALRRVPQAVHELVLETQG